MRAATRAGWFLRTFVVSGVASWLGCTTPLEALPRGAPPALAEGEGLLVVHTRSPWPIDRLSFGHLVLEDVPEGRHALVVRVPAGAYRWSRIETLGFDIEPDDDPKWRFSVEAGKLNYPGQVVVSAGGTGRYTSWAWFGVRDRSGEWTEDLLAQRPDLLSVPFAGADEDWIVRFRRAVTAYGNGTLPPEIEPPPEGRYRDADGWFRRPDTRGVQLSPLGTYVAIEQSGLVGRRDVFVTRPDALGARKRVIGHSTLLGFHWLDDDSLLVMRKGGHARVIEFELDHGEVVERSRAFPQIHAIVDPLPYEKDAFLVPAQEDLARVFRVRLGEIPGDPEAPRPYRLEGPLAEVRALVLDWIVDRRGEVRAALGRTTDGEPALEIWYKPGDWSSWRVLRSGAQDVMRLRPLAFDGDGNLLVGLARPDGGYALWALDPDSNRLEHKLFEHATAKVERVIFDATGRTVLGVELSEASERSVHFFDDAAAEYQRAAEKTFGDARVHILEFVPGGRYFTALIEGSALPAEFYLFDTVERTADSLGLVTPWITEEVIATPVGLEVAIADGRRARGTLTLPAGVPSPPLVVLLYGGPMGAGAGHGPDRIAQYLASTGIAVLDVDLDAADPGDEVFLGASERRWRDGVSEEVDGLLAEVLRAGHVDGDRLCIAGGGFGGLEAVEIALRSPGRFRCVATLSAVLDLEPLRVQARQEGPAWLAEAIDAREGGARAGSLPERARELDVPIFLAHSYWDDVIDVDHFYRMRRMLAIHGRVFEWMVIPRMEHTFPTRPRELEYYRVLRAFIGRHLERRSHGRKRSRSSLGTIGQRPSGRWKSRCRTAATRS